MTDSPTGVQGLPLAAVQQALRKTTEFLAHELAHPHQVAPDWSDLEWRIARAVVTIHGISGLLAGSTRWQGPLGWDTFLMDQREQVRQRQARIEALVRVVDAAARANGVPLVALKGAALHAHGVYTAGERPMADLDLLAAPADMVRAAHLLIGLNFQPRLVTWKHQVFEPVGSAHRPSAFGENHLNPIKIELHSCVREMLPLRPVDITALVWPSSTEPGINDYASRASLLLHLLLHASGAMIIRVSRLLQLEDIVRLTRSMSAADWDELFQQAAGSADPHLWWAYPPLALTDRYFDCIPDWVLERLAAACQWHLRRTYGRRLLSEVSLSHLWVSAFPGIEWSRSLREMLAYAAVRVRPAPETVTLRETFAEVQPLVSGGQWAYTSQGRRIVRWLLARQPRQESLYAVRESLAHPLS